MPSGVGKNFLFSPANIGPISVERQVVTIHDIVPIDLPELLNWKFAFWYKQILPRLVKKVSHIIAISEFTKQQLVKQLGVCETKISVVYNGVDDQFLPNHLAAQGFYLLRARTQLREITGILRN